MVTLKTQKLAELIHNLMTGRAVLKTGRDTLRLRLRCCGALGVGFKRGGIKYKKEEGRNLLKSLNRKRQNQAVNRQDRAVERQKLLALLSVICQCPVC